MLDKIYCKTQNLARTYLRLLNHERMWKYATMKIAEIYMVGPQPARYRLAVGSGQKSGRRVGSGRVEIFIIDIFLGKDI